MRAMWAPRSWTQEGGEGSLRSRGMDGLGEFIIFSFSYCLSVSGINR